MGQQQLLLLVLGIVIVGLAVVIGIQAFNEKAKEANADALVYDVFRIASDVQAFALKPEVFGGGGGDFEGVSFERLGYNTKDGVYKNLNGTFEMSANPNRVTVVGFNYDFGNSAKAIITGTRTEDIDLVRQVVFEKGATMYEVDTYYPHEGLLDK